MDCSLPGSSVCGISQARILESTTVSFSRGIFLTQGLNLHLLHWQADSLPLSHLGSPSWSQVCRNGKWKGYISAQEDPCPCRWLAGPNGLGLKTQEGSGQGLICVKAEGGFVNLFIQEIFAERLPSARHCLLCRGHRDEPDNQGSGSQGVYGLVDQSRKGGSKYMTTGQVDTFYKQFLPALAGFPPSFMQAINDS